MSPKKIILVFLIFNAAFSAHAQLTNTKWTTTLQLEDKVSVLFDFKQDTLKAITVGDNAVMETMTYTLQDSTLKIKRVSGQSNCDTNVVGVYQFKIEGNDLELTLIADDCGDRSAAIDKTRWTKIE